MFVSSGGGMAARRIAQSSFLILDDEFGIELSCEIDPRLYDELCLHFTRHA